MDPVVAAKIAQLTVQQLKDEKKRQKILAAALTILGLVLFMYSIVVYIVTHPLDAIFGEHPDGIKIELEDGSAVTIRDYSKVEDVVWSFLKDIGFSDHGAAGAMGNIRAESSFDTSACHSGIYHGLCQWGMGRWDGNPVCLKNFAELKGTEWTDLQTQLSYFELECRVSYPSVYKQMIDATDVQYACDYFCTKYEICVGKGGDWAYSMVDGKPYQDLAKRRRFAKSYYEHYVGQ